MSFNALDYIASNADLISAFGTNEDAATAHYVTYGYREGRRSTFNATQFIRNYAELQNRFGSDTNAATRYYIERGRSLGLTDHTFSGSQINGTSGDDTLWGFGGNDTISGGAGADTIYGGCGNDLLSGGTGADTYWFPTSDFGNDTIAGANDNSLDSINFGTNRSSDAYLSRSGNNLIISIGANSVTISDWGLDAGHKLNNFMFSDGSKTTDGTSWI